MTDAASGAGTAPPSWRERLRGRWARRPHRDHGSGRNGGSPPRTAFVLAGGGSRGAVQVGMLEALIRRGIRADRVFGASVGAINGASYAGNPTIEGIERMADIWRDVKGTDIFPRGTFDGPWAFLQKRAGRARQHGAARHHRGRHRLREPRGRRRSHRGGDHVAHRRARALDHPRSRGRGHPRLVGHPLDLPARHHRRRRPRRRRRGQQRPDQPGLAAGCERIYVLLCGPLHYHPPPAEAPGRGRADRLLRRHPRALRARAGRPAARAWRSSSSAAAASPRASTGTSRARPRSSRRGGPRWPTSSTATPGPRTTWAPRPCPAPPAPPAPPEPRRRPSRPRPPRHPRLHRRRPHPRPTPTAAPSGSP